MPNIQKHSLLNNDVLLILLYISPWICDQPTCWCISRAPTLTAPTCDSGTKCRCFCQIKSMKLIVWDDWVTRLHQKVLEAGLPSLLVALFMPGCWRFSTPSHFRMRRGCKESLVLWVHVHNNADLSENLSSFLYILVFHRQSDEVSTNENKPWRWTGS